MFNTVEFSRQNSQTETHKIIDWKLTVPILRLSLNEDKYFNNFGDS